MPLRGGGRGGRPHRRPRKKYRARYPWDKWFATDGGWVTITKGTDYLCMTHSMMQMVRYEARARGRKIKQKTWEEVDRKGAVKEGISLYVYAMKKRGTDPGSVAPSGEED